MKWVGIFGLGILFTTTTRGSSASLKSALVEQTMDISWRDLLSDQFIQLLSAAERF
ncbi:MAG: hypothetical protein ACERKX_06630 [Anaerolineales bacterium]